MQNCYRIATYTSSNNYRLYGFGELAMGKVEQVHAKSIEYYRFNVIHFFFSKDQFTKTTTIIKSKGN